MHFMAGFNVDIYEKSVEVDLHDYSHTTALEEAREKVKEAYEHGFRYIRFIHGAADIRNKKEGGSIKFALRAMLKSGALDRWVEKAQEKHRLEGGSTLLALRPNPAPGDAEWKEMPLPEYR